MPFPKALPSGGEWQRMSAGSGFPPDLYSLVLCSAFIHETHPDVTEIHNCGMNEQIVFSLFFISPFIQELRSG